MSDDNLQLVTIALQLLETVSRQEGIDISVCTEIGAITAYNSDSMENIASVERL